jgi:hypothetical protein
MTEGNFRAVERIVTCNYERTTSGLLKYGRRHHKALNVFYEGQGTVHFKR